MEQQRIFLALGTNLGDREENLALAFASLFSREIMPVIESPIYETPPMGGPPGQRDFYNQVIEVRTNLPPRALLGQLLSIEAELGRERREQNGPRIIDIDLLAYGETILNDPDLTLPHPECHKRTFVLVPWRDIAPEFEVPGHGKTVDELCEAFNADSEGMTSVGGGGAAFDIEAALSDLGDPDDLGGHDPLDPYADLDGE